MLAAIDIHKAVFQTAVLDPAEGEITEERFSASREALVAWAEKWDGKLSPAQTIPGDWTERARWAEARRDAALMQANAAELARDAAVSDMVRQLVNVQRSASWRLTRPLRWLKSRFSRRPDEPSRDGNSPGPLPSRQR